jgi:hypothetical protein
MVKPNNIDSSDHVLHVQFDTMRWYRNKAGIMEHQGTEAVTYGQDGKPLATYYRNGHVVSNTSFIYYYDKLIRRQEYTRDTVLGDYNEERFYIYDAFGNLVIDSSVDIQNPLSKKVSHFTHDAAGRYTSHLRSQGGLSYYFYNSDGTVAAVFYPISYDSTLSSYDSFFYKPGIPGFYKKGIYGKYYGNQYSYGQIRFLEGKQGTKDTMIVIESVIPYLSPVYTNILYNSFGNPVQRVSTKNGYGSNSQRLTTYYYYEFYDQALAMEQTKRQPVSIITLAPNPTTGSITLYNLPNERLTVYITNPQGQMIYSQSAIIKTGSLQLTLSGDIAPGIFIVTVGVANNTVIYNSTFIKQ